MPIVHIHLRAGRTAAEKKAILDGLHAAFVEALKIPEVDRNQFVHEYTPEHFEARYGPDAVFVEATVFPGRSRDAKRKLSRLLVATLARARVPKGRVLAFLPAP